MDGEVMPPLLECTDILSRLEKNITSSNLVVENDAAIPKSRRKESSSFRAGLHTLQHRSVVSEQSTEPDSPSRSNPYNSLQDITLELAKTGLLLEAELQSGVPAWQEWVLMAAKRRTILAAHMLMWAWSLKNRYPPFACFEISFMPTPAPKMLWHAQSEGWESLYSNRLSGWLDGGPQRLEELMVIGPEIEIAPRSQRWLEEADEFGVLLMSEAVERIDIINDSLDNFARSTTVLINAVGPYSSYGTPVPESCANNGTSYLDFSTETPWIEEMIRKYHAKAKQNLARIIPAIGNSSSPSAITAYVLAKQHQKLYGAPVQEILSSYDMKVNGMSSGSLSSMIDVVSHYGISPLLFPKPQRLSLPSEIPQTHLTKPFLGHKYDADLGHLATSFGAPGNEAVVYRSQHLQKSIYDPEFTYHEFMPMRSTTQAIITHLLTKFAILLLWLPPFRALINSFKPEPGTGPSKEVARGERIRVRAIARGNKSEKPLTTEYLYEGSMYHHAAMLAAEAAMVLLSLRKAPTGSSQKDEQFGILTPSCLEMPFVERLRNASVKIDVSE
ncbi:uncharacterized protein Z518_10431 [Rhinocladiella mackenziei CBS 650.93]|uniref:Saccharopine dehydrogenase NADP binding domain-containing protein n=1 Tax=Rhinocladiella mackenziei CBS 650.93 TaxID=1442369 RepID=A0A0D2FDX5_9EURO|nr:uncharacterized protein Z518_10431 [Rhinocladiella mackenziei CBS 650.93]KIX00292.1 hypothetical protein Z518_10431 [Rhinocladiella mackenziei CBS 650.93]